MTALERVEKLMALLAIGFAWAHKIGEWRATTQKPILFKKHRDSFRPQNNLFRYGFDFIRELILNPFCRIVDFIFSLHALIPNTLIAEPLGFLYCAQKNKSYNFVLNKTLI